MPAFYRTLSLRQFQRHRGRATLVVASIALGVAAWTTMAMLDRAMSAALRGASAPIAGAADLYVSNGDAGLPRELANCLSQVDSIASVTPIVVARVLLPEFGPQPAVLLGVDAAAADIDAAAVGVHFSAGAPARFLTAKLLRAKPVLLSEALQMAIAPRSERLKVIAGGRQRDLTIAGTFGVSGDASALDSSVLLTDDRTAAELAGHSERVSRFDVRLKPGVDSAQARRQLAAAIGAAGEVLTPEAHAGSAVESLAALRVGFGLCGIAALGLGLFLVANIIAVGVVERRRDIGILRTLGATQRQILRLVLGESAALGIVGGALGVPLGWTVARFALTPMIRVLGDVFVPLDSPAMRFEWQTALTGVAAGLATTVLASFSSAAKAAAEPAVESLAIGPTWGPRSAFVPKIAPWLLAAAAFTCFSAGEKLPSHLRLYGALVLGLLAAILAIPAMASVGAKILRPIAQGVLGLPGRLAAESLIHVPAHAGTAIAAVAAGVALMIQTSEVIQGNTMAIRDWVDRTVSGDLFVTAGGPLSASGRTVPMDDSVCTEIERTLPGAGVVPMRFHRVPWRYRGAVSNVRLFALDARRYVAMNTTRRPPLADLDLYKQLAEPGTVLVSENFAALYGIDVGDSIELPGCNQTVRLRVIGKVVDFSNGRGTVLIDRSRYQTVFDVEGADVFAIGLPPGSADLGAARQQILRASWAAEHAVEVMTRPALREHILGMVGRLYGLAYIQEIIVAAVASLGVAMAMLVAVLQRRRELRLLRAAGATKHQVFATVIAEAVLINVIGVVFGMAIGVPFGWYFLRVILLHDTGFSFPVLFPRSDAVLIAVLVIVSGLVAGTVPAIDASRGEVREARS
jgi:putative ABC transport system permease protein